MRSAAAARTARSRPVVATTSWTSHAPAAMTSVLKKYRSMWTRFQAVARLSRSMPLGHNAMGIRSVSWVGVIADLASHRIGPSPTTSRNSSITTWTSRRPMRDRGSLPVGIGHEPRSSRVLDAVGSGREPTPGPPSAGPRPGEPEVDGREGGQEQRRASGSAPSPTP